MPLGLDKDTADKLADLGRRAAKERGRFHARKPKAVKNVVADVIAKRGYASTGASERVAEAWAEAAGPVLARHSRAGALRRGVLEVLVASSVMMQEIQFHRPRLLADVQRALPDARITGLKLRVGRV